MYLGGDLTGLDNFGKQVLTGGVVIFEGGYVELC
jgi:hypothetical protein